jgi:hypothetical protein
MALTCPKCRADLPGSAKFCLECGEPVALEIQTRSPESYTPKHLAEKILTSKAALEGERKQVTVLFADLKGSMELLADRDPEEARKLRDPVLERMMEAVRLPRYAAEGLEKNSSSTPPPRGVRSSLWPLRSVPPRRGQAEGPWWTGEHSSARWLAASSRRRPPPRPSKRPRSLE